MRSKFKWIFTLLMAFSIQFSFAQEKTVTGTITEGGQPLPGVSVVVKGTTKGTQSDFDGKYSISAKAGEVLEFTYIGLKKQTKTVGASSTINVSMEEDAEQLTEVVLVGYTTETKAKTTSAISRVDSKQIEQVPVASLDQVLQGNVAGANIKVGSGQPGSSGTILIRGRNSIQGNVEPLFVIDGVPVSEDNFRGINANDIEDIQVLKDAAASALYGARGAGGVIVVTTKKGKYNSGTSIQYRALYGISTQPEPGFEVMNTRQYLTFQRDIGGRGFGFSGTSGTINEGGALSDAQIEAYAQQSNTDWSKIFFQNGITNSQELNMNSGNEKMRSYTSINYFNQEGITLRSELERFTFRNNFDVKASDKFTYGSQVTLAYSVSDFVVDRLRDNNTGGQLDNPFIVPYLGLPYMSPYSPNGEINIYGTQLSGAYDANGNFVNAGINGFLNTPYLALNTQTLNTDQESEFRGLGTIYGDYKFNDKFKIGTKFGVDYTNEERLTIDTPESWRGQIATRVPTSVNKGAQYEEFFREARFNITNYLTYSQTFKEKHNLEVSAFQEYFYFNQRTSGFEAYGLNPKLPGSSAGFTAGITQENGAVPYVPAVFSQTQEFSIFSLFSVAKYDYDGRLGVQGSLRSDTSSRFAPENQSEIFYSVSGFWNLSREKFLENNKTISNLKLRASYGTAGNQGVGTLYNAFELIAVNQAGYNGQFGYQPLRNFDENLRWEVTTQSNIGVDFGFVENRLSGSVDVYNKYTTDLFFDRPTSAVSGFGSVTTNIGEMSNKGIELSLSWDIIRNNDWNLNVFFNGAYNKNTIEKLAGTDFVGPGGTIPASQALEVGRPLGSFWLTRYVGVDPSNGAPLYLDINGNVTNVYSDNDRVFLDKTSDPLYTGGFGLNVSYKNWSLNSLFAFAAEQYRTNGSLALIQDPTLSDISNQEVGMLNSWQNVGDITAYPSVNFGTRLFQNDRYLEDASFLRLRNLTFAYTFDKEMLAKTKAFTGIRVYFQGQNVFTWSKWKGFDPESTTTSAFFDYPTPKQFTFGLDVNF